MTELELMALAQRVYVSALFLICVPVLLSAGLKRTWQLILTLDPLKRTGAVLAVNWTILTAFVIASDIHDPWWIFIPIDAASAAIVMHQPAGKQQSVVGSLYMAQIVAHGVYGALKLGGESASANGYWQILSALAFVQLILVGGWAVGRYGGKLARHLRLRRHSAVAGAESRKGVAR